MVESTKADEPSRSGAMRRLGDVLTRTLVGRNFAMSYLARRCQTSMAVVKSWLAGQSVPSRADWSALCALSRDLLDHVATWEAATLEEKAVTIEIDRWGVASGVVATALIDHGGSDEALKICEVAQRIRQAATSTRTDLADPPTVDVDVPVIATTRQVEIVPFVCKLSRGRFVQLPLPIDLTRADVDRIHAFLLTQVDDPEPME